MAQSAAIYDSPRVTVPTALAFDIPNRLRASFANVYVVNKIRLA